MKLYSNTQQSPEELRRLAVIQTLWKNSQGVE